MSLQDRGWTRHSKDISVPIHVTETVTSADHKKAAPYGVEYADGDFDLYGDGEPLFKILVATRPEFERLLKQDAYSLAMKFVRAEFSVEGDLVAAVHFYNAQPHSRAQAGFIATLAKFGIGRIESWFQTKGRAAQNIRFHYDQSNDFYGQFLDSRMVYSCAYFKDPGQSLEEAQLQKLEHICRKLNLQRGERFLDVGCGWGGLVTHAADEYESLATGCTLSVEQFNFANQQVAERNLGRKVTVELSDYRDMGGSYDKIASVGMFEHVGRRRLQKYFATLNRLLRPGGLVLNHGITRPESVHDGPETLFVRRKVFPGGELAHLSDVIRFAERAGFEVLDVENLRPHYALTCRAWVQRLQENMTQCLRQVDQSAYRTWLLALAASAATFEDGRLNVNQLLLYKPGDSTRRPFTRDYMYG
ncbi:MAG: cyclopropane-fatty-acyl-phospholipid synthase family protein [Candidatus Acidiferrales bacterium]